MRLFRHVSHLPDDARGASLALGNFDGVHRGHQAVLAAARAAAASLAAPLGVVTFEPHPRLVFRPDQAPFRLSPLRMKVRLLAAEGVDLLFVLRFDRRFVDQSAECCVDHLLVERLGARHVTTGTDFRFGHQRMGDVAMLARHGRLHGFGVTAIRAEENGSGKTVSSTRVREALRAGDPRLAAQLLGHPWEIAGRVRDGDRLGRTIGFPTANLELGSYLRPMFGVYAVMAALDGPGPRDWWPGVANIGRRPTMGGSAERLEVHLFDQSPDLYRRVLRVRLIDFIRAERRFDSREALSAQIAEDTARARAMLATAGGGVTSGSI